MKNTYVASNLAKNAVSRALQNLRLVADKEGEPLKSVSYTVRLDGTTSTIFRHRRKVRVKP